MDFKRIIVIYAIAVFGAGFASAEDQDLDLPEVTEFKQAVQSKLDKGEYLFAWNHLTEAEVSMGTDQSDQGQIHMTALNPAYSMNLIDWVIGQKVFLLATHSDLLADLKQEKLNALKEDIHFLSDFVLYKDNASDQIRHIKSRFKEELSREFNKDAYDLDSMTEEMTGKYQKKLDSITGYLDDTTNEFVLPLPIQNLPYYDELGSPEDLIKYYAGLGDAIYFTEQSCPLALPYYERAQRSYLKHQGKLDEEELRLLGWDSMTISLKLLACHIGKYDHTHLADLFRELKKTDSSFMFLSGDPFFQSVRDVLSTSDDFGDFQFNMWLLWSMTQKTDTSIEFPHRSYTLDMASSSLQMRMNGQVVKTFKLSSYKGQKTLSENEGVIFIETKTEKKSAISIFNPMSLIHHGMLAYDSRSNPVPDILETGLLHSDQFYPFLSPIVYKSNIMTALLPLWSADNPMIHMFLLGTLSQIPDNMDNAIPLLLKISYDVGEVDFMKEASIGLLGKTQIYTNIVASRLQEIVYLGDLQAGISIHMRIKAADALRFIQKNEAIIALNYMEGAPNKDEFSYGDRVIFKNASIALEPYSPDSLPYLIQELSSDSWQRRFGAARAIGKMGAHSEVAVPALIQAGDFPNDISLDASLDYLDTKLRPDEKKIVLNEIISSLGNFGPSAKDAIPHLKNLWLMPVRKYVDALDVNLILAMGQIGINDAEVLALLSYYAQHDGYEAYQRVGNEPLQKIESSVDNSQKRLIELLSSPIWEIRFGAMYALKRVAPVSTTAVPQLGHLLKLDQNLGYLDFPEQADLLAVIDFLVKIGVNNSDVQNSDVKDALIAALDNPDENVREKVIQILGTMNPNVSGVVEGLKKAVNDPRNQCKAILQLCNMAKTNSEVIPAVLWTLNHENSKVQIDAIYAVERMGPTAQFAISPLFQLAMDNSDARRKERAIDALSSIGPSALAYLSYALRNERTYARYGDHREFHHPNVLSVISTFPTQTIPMLLQSLSSQDPLEQYGAIIGLRNIYAIGVHVKLPDSVYGEFILEVRKYEEQVTAALIEIWKTENDSDAKSKAFSALLEIKTESYKKLEILIQEYQQEKDNDKRILILFDLIRIKYGYNEIVPVCKTASEDECPQIRELSIYFLATKLSPYSHHEKPYREEPSLFDAEPILRRALRDNNPLVRKWAESGMERIKKTSKR